MSVYELTLGALEPWLFGDSRSTRSAVDHLVLDQDPSPLTLHGAIGQLVIDRWSGAPDWPGEILGARQPDILEPTSDVAELLGFCYATPSGSRYFPKPRHLRCRLRPQRQEVVAEDLLRPSALAGGVTSAQPEFPRLALPRGDDELDEYPGEVLVDEEALGELLRGEVPEIGLELPAAIFRSEPRPGIAVDNTAGTVFEGAFFTRPYRRFEPAPLAPGGGLGGFVAWLAPLAPLGFTASDAPGFLGGDRRRTRFRWEELSSGREAVLGRLRDGVLEAAAEADGGFYLYLLTPALARCLPVCDEAGRRPVAAVVGKPHEVSGWDRAHARPRAMETLVPAGSVFFFAWPEQADRRQVVETHWLRPAARTGAAAGFGRCLVGVWS